MIIIIYSIIICSDDEFKENEEWKTYPSPKKKRNLRRRILLAGISSILASVSITHLLGQPPHIPS